MRDGGWDQRGGERIRELLLKGNGECWVRDERQEGEEEEKDVKEACSISGSDQRTACCSSRFGNMQEALFGVRSTSCAPDPQIHLLMPEVPQTQSVQMDLGIFLPKLLLFLGAISQCETPANHPGSPIWGRPWPECKWTDRAGVITRGTCRVCHRLRGVEGG